MLLALRYYSNHIDTDSQQPQQYGSCEQGPRFQADRGTQRNPRQRTRFPGKTSWPVSIPNANQENAMHATQYEEHLAHSAPCASRWDGFDRGDADWDYDEERRAQNEADEAELRAEGLL